MVLVCPTMSFSFNALVLMFLIQMQQFWYIKYTKYIYIWYIILCFESLIAVTQICVSY